MTSDGRRVRGQERRRLLVEATLEVVAERGVAGLSHRAVAEHAGVSLASASYHFAGLDELVATALVQANAQVAAAMRADGDRSPARLAAVIAEEIEHHRGLWIAGYELYLLALRRPQLRGPALEWLEVVADTFAPELRGPARRAFQATVEGVCLHALFADAPPDPTELEAVLTLGWPGP